MGLLLLMAVTGCVKEYSYEGGLSDTVIIPPADTLIIEDSVDEQLVFATCDSCTGKDDFFNEKWSFSYDTNFFCGTVTNAVVTPTRNGFTFFGPSACSVDSGLIISAFLPNVTLTTDLENITTTDVALEYYDNISGDDIMYSDPSLNLSLTILTYDHTTRLAKGTYSGYVFSKNKEVIKISNGKFITALH